MTSGCACSTCPPHSSARLRDAGRIVLEVVDHDGRLRRRRFALDAEPDGAECTRTTESADLRLSQRALASTYLGDQRCGRWRSPAASTNSPPAR